MVHKKGSQLGAFFILPNVYEQRHCESCVLFPNIIWLY
jgi:hypothetical protein